MLTSLESASRFGNNRKIAPEFRRIDANKTFEINEEGPENSPAE
jgi:hypothetical protein